MKSGVAGTNNLNLLLREKLNPASRDKEEIEIHKNVFRVGDKVMQTSNNYEQEWIKQEGDNLIGGKGVFNGDMGHIDFINKKSGEVYVTFDDGRRAGYSIVDLEDLVLAYAITIHKSQGSEYPAIVLAVGIMLMTLPTGGAKDKDSGAVIIPVLGGNPMLYNKNLLYTAVTRAKKMVVLIGKKTNIYHMIKNNYQTKRNTMLKKFLQENTYALS